jgi:fused signal recognition particle receptor
MWNALKDKLRSVREKLGARIEEKEAEVLSAPAPGPAAAEPAPATAVTPPKEAPPAPEEAVSATRSKPSFVEKVKVFVKERELIITEKEIEGPLQELELVLLESDVALPATEAIIAHVREDLVGKHRRIRESSDAVVFEALKGALLSVLGNGLDLAEYIRQHKRPVKILFTGVNGTGKTTTVAKVGDYLKRQGFSVVIGSGDTYRAGALEQLSIHADRVGIKVIQHQQGADPSAVLFDAVQFATSHGVDVVLADTAGRFHNRANLMNQLDKIKRVMKPDLVVYVDEAVAGNDAVVRAQEFNKWVGTDAVVLTKADIDPKGGAAISITHTIGKPILFLGTGQGYGDIVPFTPHKVVEDLLGGGEA